METKGKILIIDDEHDMVEFLKIRLTAEGYDVHTAFDGLEGWQKVKEVFPDLVILDVMMPKIDGFNVCKLIKSDSTCNDIPVIILTARGQEHDKKIGKEVDADAYIIKPFESKELLETVDKLLNEPLFGVKK